MNGNGEAASYQYNGLGYRVGKTEGKLRPEAAKHLEGSLDPPEPAKSLKAGTGENHPLHHRPNKGIPQPLGKGRKPEEADIPVGRERSRFLWGRKRKPTVLSAGRAGQPAQDRVGRREPKGELRL